MYVYIFVCMYVGGIYPYIYTYNIYVCMYICMYVGGIYMYLYVCMYKDIDIYPYIHIYEQQPYCHTSASICTSKATICNSKALVK